MYLQKSTYKIESRPFRNFHRQTYAKEVNVSYSQSFAEGFLSYDPLADKLPSYSPYCYVYNNPIIMVDEDGFFGSRADARRFRRQTGIGGRINKHRDENGKVFFIERNGDGAQLAFGSMAGGYKETPRNWGGIGFFTRKGGSSGNNETRKSWNDVLMVNIDKILSALGIRGRKQISKEPGNLVKSTKQAASEIKNLLKAYKISSGVVNEVEQMSESAEKGDLDPHETVEVYFTLKQANGTTSSGGSFVDRKDSAATADRLKSKGYDVTHRKKNNPNDGK